MPHTEGMEKIPLSGNRPSSPERKEGAPTTDTVYAYIRPEAKRSFRYQIHGVLGFYTDKEAALQSARLDDLFVEEEESLVPLHVYKTEEELPEAIRKHIHPIREERPPTPVPAAEEGAVYAIMPNTDSTEGSEYDFIWVVVSDPELAGKIAYGNGVCGSDAKIFSLPLNQLNDSKITVRRDKNNQVIDELFGN